MGNRNSHGNSRGQGVTSKFNIPRAPFGQAKFERFGGRAGITFSRVQGLGDKWACPLPADRFANVQDAWLTLHDFMQFCNIVESRLSAGGSLHDGRNPASARSVHRVAEG